MGCWLRPPACGGGLGAPDRPRSRAIRQSTRPSRPAVRTGSQALQKGHRPLASVHVVWRLLCFIPPSRAPWHQSSNVMDVDPNILWDSSSQPSLRRAASRSVKLIAQRVGVTERDVVEMNRRLQKAPLSRRELHVKSAFQPRKRHSECWQPIRKARWASFLGSE